MTAFSKNLRKLREEKKISQKAAAASLGVSQALLSHYEKGIRECGLTFLAKSAKYYGVTSDYLLGINEPEINLKDINGEISKELREEILSKLKDGELKKDGVEINVQSVLYKNLIINAVIYVFDKMKDLKFREVSILSGKYLSLCVYRLAGLLFANFGNVSSEKLLTEELKYISGLREINILGEYNCENPYLNNIAKSAFMD